MARNVVFMAAGENSDWRWFDPFGGSNFVDVQCIPAS
jgi:hypothetical protein